MDTLMTEIGKNVDKLYVDITMLKADGYDVKSKEVIKTVNDKLTYISELFSKRFGMNIKITYTPGRKIIYYKMTLPNTLTGFIPEKVLKNRIDLVKLIDVARKEGVKLLEFTMKKLKDIKEPVVDRNNLTVIGLDNGGRLDVVINEDVLSELKPSMFVSLVLRGVNDYFYNLEVIIANIRFLRMLGEYYYNTDAVDKDDSIGLMAKDIQDFKKVQERLIDIYIRDRLVIKKLGFSGIYLKTLRVLDELSTITVSVIGFAVKCIAVILVSLTILMALFVTLVLITHMGAASLTTVIAVSHIYVLVQFLIGIEFMVLIYGTVFLIVGKAIRGTFVGLQFDKVNLVKEANNVKMALIKELRSTDDKKAKAFIMEQINEIEYLLTQYKRINEYVNRFKLDEKDIINKLMNNDLYVELEKITK